MHLQIPAYCAKCNAFFASGFALGPFARVQLESCKSACPQGHLTQVLDGAFEIRDGVLTVFDGTGSQPVMERLKKLAQDAVAGKSDPEEAIKAIEQLAPGLAPVLRAFGKNNSLLAIALALWFIVEMTKALHPAGGDRATSVKIENNPTILNQVTISSEEVRSAPGPREKLSKRAKRRHQARARAKMH